jgi:putative oxidoreductase
MNNITILIARILIAQIFLISGLSKLGGGYAATQAYMAMMGTPAVLLPLVIILEIGGGLALIIGFRTRWVALLLALFCIAAAIIFHHNLGDKIQLIMFMKNLAMAGGLLLLQTNGAGAFSLDAARAGNPMR